jgi:NAD(P)-dependent dehydrogenase (short-subunit alcohol dehydrogenase family)
MSHPVLVVFGAGPNIGVSVLKKFKDEGYKTAAISRDPSDEIKAVADKAYSLDLTSGPEKVEQVLQQISHDLGDPTVIVYNGETQCSPERIPHR